MGANTHRLILTLRREALYFALYFLLACVCVFRVPYVVSTHLAYGAEESPTVATFNLWTLRHNIQALGNGYRDYWEAPIFAPHPHAFAFSEMQPLSVVWAPLWWISGSDILTYNTTLVTYLALNGYFARRLLRQLRFAHWQSWSGSLFVLLLPFIHWQTGAIQLTSLFAIIASLESLLRFERDPRIGAALQLGLWVGITFLLCNYYGLFLGYLLVNLGWILCRRSWWNWRFWGLTVVAASLAVLIVTPIVKQQLLCKERYQWQRDKGTISNLSAWPGDYASQPTVNFTAFDLSAFSNEYRRPYWVLGTGTLSYAFAAIGLARGIIIRQRRLWTMFVALMIALFFMTSLGYQWKIGDAEPYDYLVQWFPGFAQIRTPFRGAILVQLGVALLATEGIGVSRIRAFRWLVATWRCPENVTQWLGQRRVAFIRLLGYSLLLIPSCMIAAENWPAPTRLYQLPSPDWHRHWVSWIKEHGDPLHPVAYFPFPGGAMPGDYKEATDWMYLALGHNIPSVYGYSGFFPKESLALKERLRYFPHPDVLSDLRRVNVKYLIIRRSWVTSHVLLTPETRRAGLSLAFEDHLAEVDVYELKSPAGAQ